MPDKKEYFILTRFHDVQIARANLDNDILDAKTLEYGSTFHGASCYHVINGLCAVTNYLAISTVIT